MKNKIIGIILTILIFAVPISVSLIKSKTVSPSNVEHVNYTNVFVPAPTTGIAGPSDATIGELVRLVVKGEQVKWQCLPKTEDIETFGDANDKCVISFRANGAYTIIAAVVNSGKVTLETLNINVGGSVPVPTPNNPTPNNSVARIDAALAAQVKGWASDSKVNAAQAAKLAANFKQVATEAQAGTLVTTGDIINRTASLNQSLDLKGFDGVMAKVQAYLTQQADAGVLTTTDQHVTVWFSIASGLEQYAAQPSGSKR